MALCCNAGPLPPCTEGPTVPTVLLVSFSVSVLMSELISEVIFGFNPEKLKLVCHKVSILSSAGCQTRSLDKTQS